MSDVNSVHNDEQRNGRRYLVPSIHRVFVLLEVLSESSKGLRISELSRQTGWPKSSIFNILSTLTQDGYVSQDPESSRYRMTIKLFSLGGAVVERMDIRNLAYPLLVDLVEKTGETANLGILDGIEAIYLETVAGPGAIRISTWPGKRLPIHRTALGKALAAELTEDELVAIIEKTGLPPGTHNSHTTLEALQADLKLIRQRGYAIDDEEDELAMRCVGAPICDFSGKTVAAVSVTGLAHRTPPETIQEISLAVIDTARRLSELMGYRERTYTLT